MISAEEAIRLSDNTDLGVAETIDEWLDMKVKGSCKKHWHHVTITPKDICIMHDEWGISVETFNTYVKNAGYKTSYDSDDGSIVIRWEHYNA